MAKIVSFGDSFVYGNELPNNDDGSQAWPSLVAKALDCDYETLAVPGCGNENIAQQIYRYFSNNPVDNTLAVINWTWCMRWDFYLRSNNQWVTLGPTCVPGKLEHLIGLTEAAHLIDFYRKYTSNSDMANRWRSLQAMFAAQSWMDRLGVRRVETYMDTSLLEPYAGDRLGHYANYKDESWPTVTTEQDLDLLPQSIQAEVQKDYQANIMPDFVLALQKAVGPRLQTWQGLTFLEWCRMKNYPVTDLLHPIGESHTAAADLWCDTYRQLLSA